MSKPKQKKGLVPAKNGDKIGLANPETKQFYQLDFAFLNVWLLCDGKRSEDKIITDFISFLKEKSDFDKELDEKVLKEEVKTIIKKLLKFGLLE